MSEQNNEWELLTVEEAASLLRVSKNTLNNWRCNGTSKLKYVKMGGAIRYRVVDVREYIKSCMVG